MSEWVRTLIIASVSSFISLFATYFATMYIEPLRIRKAKEEEARRLRRSLYLQLGIICQTMVGALRSVQNSEIYKPAAILPRSVDMTRFEAALKNVDTFDMIEDALQLQSVFSAFRDFCSYDLSDTHLVIAAAAQIRNIR